MNGTRAYRPFFWLFREVLTGPFNQTFQHIYYVVVLFIHNLNYT